MIFDPVLLAPRMQAMKTAGVWRDETLDDYFQRGVQQYPGKTAVAAYSHGRPEPVRLTYQELATSVDKVARGLAAIGVGPLDVVSFQLPNCWEFIALSLACARVGATANPVMPIFREHELNFMLRLAETKVFIVPKELRQFDHEAMARRMLPGLPDLKRVVVVGGQGEDSFEQVLLRDDTPPLDPCQAMKADGVFLMMYTSGTTGEPKAVMHTSNTLLSNLHAYIDIMGLDANEVVLGASPLAHLTGFGYLAMLPLLLNSTTVLQDVWDPKRALEIAAAEKVTFSMASAAFAADLCQAVEDGATPVPSFRKFNCAGAPIPPVLIERAYALMSLRISSAWGMTECGAVTVTEPERALEKSGVSDGRPVPGIEVRVVDPEGQPLSAGQTGALHIRGASLFGGYLKRPELNATTDDGWFDTGDLAYLDDEGYLRIDGRTKDIIIRGGENIPVLHVENLLYKHPAISAVAVVGYPDERLGERACAFVALKPGYTFSFQQMVAFLEQHQIAKQYFPERLEIPQDLPRTPSGKLQKFKLREMAMAFVGGRQ